MQASMSQDSDFHVVTIGWGQTLVDGLWRAIAAKSADRFSHIMHPRHTLQDFGGRRPPPGIYLFRENHQAIMPPPDVELLASLEQDGVPTIHNMILGDRVVSELGQDDALSYATFLARRVITLFKELEPSVVIGGFDAIHNGIALAVARRMGIPWFAINFSVIPPGLACFCDRMSPAARVHLTERPFDERRSAAERYLQQFENRSVQAHAYIAPPPRSVVGRMASIPARLSAVVRTGRRAQQRESLRFTEGRGAYSVLAAVRFLRRAAMARGAIEAVHTLAAPPAGPYVLFGLHFQPESSIDVWAPFFSNQMWVIELLSRSMPPSHRLLVKIHKSDVANYLREQLNAMRAFPGVDLVRPFADTRKFIEGASLVIAIQGTMGLEAALLGKPVIMLGDSPVVLFPSVSRVGEITELPDLVRRKLVESPPARGEIMNAYATYLAPFLSASHNDWTTRKTEEEVESYVRLFSALKQRLVPQSIDPLRSVS
jgi:Capsule polysaccharide biosynthesis protein